MKFINLFSARLAIAASLALSLLLVPVCLTSNASAQTETILDDFLGGNSVYPNGSYPQGPLVFDSSGNIYGTTNAGGVATDNCSGNGTGCGVVFKLTPNLSGGWTQQTLHRFTGNLDGGRPTSGVILDSAGNLYGSAGQGGSANSGPGVIFKLTPLAGGGYQESIVHSFFGLNGGEGPSSLVFDQSGNLYGITREGGDYNATNFSCNNAGCGLVFKLTPNGSGPWTETILHAFTGNEDGAIPEGLSIDAAGSLYGTTFAGGNPSCNCGVVYRLSPASNGGWRESVVHAFNGKDGGFSESGVSLDAAGNLYGMSQNGGTNGCGVVYELAKNANGYTPTLVHAFGASGDGCDPENAGLTVDQGGNLYGATAVGGDPSCGSTGCGVVFELSPQAGGAWSEIIFWSFTGPPADGQLPQGAPILDASGNIYGSTSSGGTDDGGTIYEIVP